MSISIQFEPTALQPLESNAAQFEVSQGTNVREVVAAYANATSEQEEYLNGKFIVPQNLGTGSATFRATVRAKTAVASRNVALTLGHTPIANSEDFDGTYTDEDSGDEAIDATQDDNTVFTWTETLVNLGWVAGDTVYFRLSRPAASSNDLAGDMYLVLFEIELPQTA